MSNPEHPERRKLAEYVSGALAEADASVVSRHLAECPECETTIQQIEAKSDTMLTGLRSPPPDDPYVREEEFRRAAQQAAALPDAAAAAAPAVDPPTAVSTKAPTPQLGPYKLLTKLGEGGMGAVFKAQHEHLEKLVAIKVLPKNAMNDKGAVERFRREMKAVGRLHHPNIVVAHDAGEFKGVHYLVMEYVEGCDLSTLVKKQGPLPLDRATSYVLQAARGLAFAHSKGIVHRDIKPANLLVDGEGTVKILDMGLARLDGDGASKDAKDGLTQTGQVMGTVDYMAPEQAFDTHRADAKADVYSLGCTLYRIITGRNAFDGETLVQKILAHREHAIPALASPHGPVSDAVELLYRRMMAKRPEDRPTMAEVATTLEAVGANPQAAESAAPSIVIDVHQGATVRRGPNLAASLATRSPAPAATRTKPPATGSGRTTKPPLKRIAAGLGGFALLMAGVIFIIRDKGGKELARVEAPEGSSVSISATPPQPGTPPTVTSPPPAMSAVGQASGSAPSPSADYALFAYNVTTDVPIDPSQSLTFEAYVTPSADGSPGHWVLASPTIGLLFGKTWTMTAYSEDGKQIEHAFSSVLPVAGRKTHVAGVYTPQALKLYVDGVLTATKSLDGIRRSTKTLTLHIGANVDDLLDEVRVSKSVRYDKNFTPQTRFTADADTLALYHCDEGDGNVLHDASGRGYDGKIYGARWVRADGSPIGPVPSSGTPRSTPQLAVAPFDAVQARALQEDWAAYLGTTVETKNSADMRMTLLPPGEFLMGSTPEQVEAAKKMAAEDKIGPNDAYFKTMPGEMPQHLVRIRRPLLMSTTEVTVAQFRKFAESAKYVTEAEKYGFGDGFGDEKQFTTMNEGQKTNSQGLNWRAPGKNPISDEHPATQVTWNDAVAFCNWFSEQEGRRPWYQPDGKGGWFVAASADGYRLPSEAEWEYACRAGTTTHYSFGDDKAQMPRYGWFAEEDNKMHPVARKLPNPFGLFDMHGNALEWCHDIYDAQWYEKSPSDDPVPPNWSSYGRAIRGGHLFHRAADARSAYRSYASTTNHRNWYYGFRIVRLLEPQAPAATPQAVTQLADVNSPAFQAWLKATQALPAEQQVEAVRKKLMELNPGFDGNLSHPGKAPPRIENGTVTELKFSPDGVTDLSPLRACLGLKVLELFGTHGKGTLSDLSPLRGMQLTKFTLAYTKVTDLTPLAGMPLTFLNTDVRVSDLSFLAGMPLKTLYAGNSALSDLSPLRGMPLEGLACWDTQVSDLSPLAECKNLKWLHVGRTKVTAEQVAALQQALPNCKITWDDPTKTTANPLAYLDPAFQQWVEATQKLPAEKQLEEVSKKLMELNPGFDGKLTASAYVATSSPKIENGVVVDLGLLTDHVENLAPLRALSGLRGLRCSGSIPRQGRVADLSPLSGLPLTNFNCAETQVADLSPLKGMPLKALACNNTQVADLTPLAGMQLTDVRIFHTAVSDLSPLKGMKIGILYCYNTPVSDVAPLAGMPLTSLNCSDTQVLDLTPLKGMPITSFWFHDTLVTDVTPLEGMPLKSLRFTPANITRGIDVLRGMTSLVDLGLKHATNGVGVFTPADFWKKYDAGEFAKPAAKPLAYLDPKFQQWVEATQKQPAEKQLESVSKKLVELNPGFDGVFTGYSRKDALKIENGVVTELGFVTDNVMDLSPVRALVGLKALGCGGTSPSSGSLSDLSPLGGMPLTKLGFGSSKVSDLSPLRGMPLTHLDFHYSQVSNLSPLAGMPLDYLNCGGSPRLSDLSPLKQTTLTNLICSNCKELADLSPLRGMRLTSLACSLTQVADLSPLADCKDLKSLSVVKTKVTPEQVAALQTALPDCKITWDDPAKPLAYLDPAFQQWVAATQKLSAEQQLEAVSKKLMELNPGFDGKLTGIELKPEPKIENGVVTEVGFLTVEVTDISPVRAFPGLKWLGCTGANLRQGKLADISPVAEMNLEYFNCALTAVADLSPLAGMPLTRLSCHVTKVTDLSPVAGMPLAHLNISSTGIGDLAPLEGMRLVSFNCGGLTKIRDISVLRGMPLETVTGLGRDITDFTPLESCPKLKTLALRGSKATPADIAKLQMALPNCKIEWDDPTKGQSPKQ